MGHLYHGYVSHNQMVRIGHLSQWPIDVSHSASSSATAPFVQCGWLVLHVARGNEGWFHSGFHGHLDGIWWDTSGFHAAYDIHGYAAWCLPKWIPTCRMLQHVLLMPRWAWQNPIYDLYKFETRFDDRWDVWYIYICMYIDIMTEKRILTIMIYQIMISFRDNIYIYMINQR